MKAQHAALPHLIDIAVNLTDCIFRGVDWKGNKIHEDDFECMLERAARHGVGKMIITGTSLAQSEKAIALCRRYPDQLRCTVGVHPAHSSEFTRPMDAAAVARIVEDDASMVTPTPTRGAATPEEEAAHARARLDYLAKLIDENRDVVVAVGEIGVDYAELSCCPREVQEKYFVAQLRAFHGMGLPFLFHSRECGLRFVELLEEAEATDPNPAEVPALTGIVHSFNGPPEEQDRLLARGLYLGVNGSAFRTEEMAAQVLRIPLDRLFLETDAPWCDVRPKDYGSQFVKTTFETVKRRRPFVRGQCVERRNEPCHLVQVLEAYVGSAAAAGKAVTREAVVCAQYENGVRLFGDSWL